jgi:hypothetical protein
LNFMTGNTCKHKFTACSSRICCVTHFTERWQSVISVVVSLADKLVFRKLEVTILVLEGSAGELPTAELDTGSFSESFKHNPYYHLTFPRCTQLWSSKLSVSNRFTVQYDVYVSFTYVNWPAHCNPEFITQTGRSGSIEHQNNFLIQWWFGYFKLCLCLRIRCISQL